MQAIDAYTVVFNGVEKPDHFGIDRRRGELFVGYDGEMAHARWERIYEQLFKLEAAGVICLWGHGPNHNHFRFWFTLTCKGWALITYDRIQAKR